MSLGDELESALGALDTLKPQDAAVVALSRRYADDLDESPSISLEGAWFIELIEGLTQRQVDVDRAKRFVSKVDQIHVLGLLGPKLQTALEALEMTPRARSAIRIPSGGVIPAKNAGPGGDSDDDLTRQRRERATPRQRRS